MVALEIAGDETTQFALRKIQGPSWPAYRSASVMKSIRIDEMHSNNHRQILRIIKMDVRNQNLVQV